MKDNQVTDILNFLTIIRCTMSMCSNSLDYCSNEEKEFFYTLLIDLANINKKIEEYFNK